jgi:drug/metabolite transporter (DMT)-like permease
MKKIGAIIFVIGLLAAVFAGFNIVTREKVVDIGELEIMANKNHVMDWSPAIGVALMIVGGVVYIFGDKKIA